jgi:hypothetical protein
MRGNLEVAGKGHGHHGEAYPGRKGEFVLKLFCQVEDLLNQYSSVNDPH